MPDITLVDGLPVWEGAAVLFGSPGKTHRGRHFAHSFEAGQVHLGHQHFAPADALVLDLDHLPTFLTLAYMAAKRWGYDLRFNPGDHWRAEIESVRASWLDGPFVKPPAPAPG